MVKFIKMEKYVIFPNYTKLFMGMESDEILVVGKLLITTKISCPFFIISYIKLIDGYILQDKKEFIMTYNQLVKF